MKKLAPLLILLSACVPAQDQPGQVVAANGKTVTIRGAGDYSLRAPGQGFSPTAAMVKQAQEVCPGAKFASGVPESAESWAIDYLFVCP
jgi:hypothetical protein